MVHFPNLPAERRSEVLAQLEKASAPGFDFFVLVVLSCAIATLGLITDSAAAIIGAMLVAPLMSPIIGLALASVAGEEQMFGRSARALAAGGCLAVALSALLSLTARQLPFGALIELPVEIMARTRPTPFDLGVAMAGGAAAAYALAQPHMSAALPGVAIATAIMPPLCTVGIGLSVGRWDIASGALLLFLANAAAISFAGIVVFALLGFRPSHPENRWHGMSRSVFASAALVALVSVPLVGLTASFVGEAQLSRAVRAAVASEVAALPDAQLVDVRFTAEDTGLRLFATVRTSRQPTHEQVVALQSAVAVRLQRATALELIDIPIVKLDPLVPPTPTLTPTPGPSLTPSSTTALTATPSPTLTITPSPTPTATPTQTPTPTFTPTPVLARLGGTGGLGLALRDAPAGRIVGFLPDGAPVLILYRREQLGQTEWLEVRDALGRTGWVPGRYLVVQP